MHNRLRSYFVFLGRNKLYTFVNITGFVISLMFIIIIAHYTIGELTKDKYHKDSDRTFIVHNEKLANTPYPASKALLDGFPEVETVCNVQKFWTVTEVSHNDATFASPHILLVDNTFFDIFSYDLSHGDEISSMQVGNNALISQKLANTLFPNENIIGKSINLYLNDKKQVSYVVSGVIKDFNNGSLHYNDIIIPIKNARTLIPDIDASWSFSSDNTLTNVLYIKTKEGADLQAKAKEIKEHLNLEKEHLFFTPITDIYYSDLRTGEYVGFFQKGDKFVVQTLTIIGFLILVFAIFNYISLTIAQLRFRAKEFSVNRILGATKAEIFLRAILESSIVCLISFALGLLLALAVEPYVINYLGVNISILDNSSPLHLIIYISLIVLISVVSGLIPAISTLKVQPIDAVKGSYVFTSKLGFSKAFISVQSAITMIFIACCLVIVFQVRHWLNIDLGYNQKGIVNIETGAYDKDVIEVFRNELRSYPSIIDVGSIDGVPYSDHFYSTTRWYEIDGVKNEASVALIKCDSIAAKILGINIIKDNNIAKEGVWINESTITKLGIDYDVKFVSSNPSENIPVCGIIKDYRTGNLATKDGLSPKFLNITSPDMLRGANLIVETSGDSRDALKDIETAFNNTIKNTYTENELKADFFENEIQESYQSYNQLSLIVLTFTIVAIIISSLGLFAVSLYYIKQRAKEIAIRKVYGSSRKEVQSKIILEFIFLIFIAFIIAAPITWYISNSWLEQFPLRIDLPISIYLYVLIFVLAISTLTIYFQSHRAASRNPVDMLS